MFLYIDEKHSIVDSKYINIIELFDITIVLFIGENVSKCTKFQFIIIKMKRYSKNSYNQYFEYFSR